MRRTSTATASIGPTTLSSSSSPASRTSRINACNGAGTFSTRKTMAQGINSNLPSSAIKPKPASTLTRTTTVKENSASGNKPKPMGSTSRVPRKPTASRSSPAINPPGRVAKPTQSKPQDCSVECATAGSCTIATVDAEPVDLCSLLEFKCRISGPSACPGICRSSPLDGGNWTEGPEDPAGQVVNLSDRPSLCMSVNGNQAVVGSSDHALYTVDIKNAKFGRALYGGTRGHTEWVTCVTHLADGRILSGGMDSKLFLWDPTGARCTALPPASHMASISAVQSVPGSCYAVSASYDKTLLLWDLSVTRPNASYKPAGSFVGHRGPIMGFAIAGAGGRPDVIASGSRDGAVILWDVATGAAAVHRPKAHTGHVTAIQCLQGGADEDGGGHPVFVSGGQDGALLVWDFRAKTPIHKDILHTTTKGQGALSCISVSKKSSCGCPMIVTGGADKIMKVIDPRSSFQVVHTISDHKDFIYCLQTSGSIAWSSGGDGSLLVHDIASGKCLYGLGASANGAVRCINTTTVMNKEYLVCSGDDGNVIIYSSP